jgi:hypothetical protein
MADPVKVTVTDPATGEVLEEKIVDDDYLILCAGRTYLHHVQKYQNGTHVITIKECRNA